MVIDIAGFAALGAHHRHHDDGPANASWLYWGGFLVFAVLVAIVIAAASHPASLLGRALATQPLKYIGQRSYGLYLWHWPVFMVLRPGLDVPIEGFANLVLRLGVTFALAELSYRFVEMPIRRGELRANGDSSRTLSRGATRPSAQEGCRDRGRAGSAHRVRRLPHGRGIPAETATTSTASPSMSALDASGVDRAASRPGPGRGTRRRSSKPACRRGPAHRPSARATVNPTASWRVGESVMLGARAA